MAPVSKTVGLRRVTTQVLPYVSFPFKGRGRAFDNIAVEALAQRQARGRVSEGLCHDGRTDARPGCAPQEIPPPMRESQRPSQQPSQRQNRGSAIPLRVKSSTKLKPGRLLS